jgi:opacity protein-like surface antigen
MRLSARCLVAATALAVPAPPIAAQIDTHADRPIRIGLGGGVTVPTSDYKDALQQGYNGQGFILFRPAGFPVGLRATFTYNRFNVENFQVGQDGQLFPGGGQTGQTVTDGYTQILGALGNLTFELPTGRVRPYLLAGLGAFNVKNQAETATETGSTSSTEFGVDGGAGVRLRLFGLDAYLEGRIANVYTDRGFVDTKSVKYVPITFGILF